MTVFDAVLFVAATLAAAYLLLVAIMATVSPLRRLGRGASRAFSSPFTGRFAELADERRLGELEEEVRRAIGLDDQTGDGERTDVIKAAVAAQEITVLNRSLRKSVSRCLQTHWAVAKGLGAIEMAEAARHPQSRRFRQRVIDLSGLLTQRLEQYPLLDDAPELLTLQLGIRWLSVTCITCPYFTSSVATAPAVCPTARALGQRFSSTSSTGERTKAS